MLLIIGCNSKIAPFIREIFKGNDYFLSDRKEGFNYKIDLNYIDDINFDIRITHAIVLSAITNIEYCNKQPNIAKKINGLNTLKLIKNLNKKGIKVLFPSSTCVFSNKSETVKNELSKTNGDTIYGQIKADVEKNIIENKLNTVLRMTKIISPDDHLLQKWKDDLINKRAIKAYTDLRLAPLSVFTVAEFIKKWFLNNFNGIIHLSPTEDISYFDFAEKLSSFLSIDKSYVQKESVSNSQEKILYLPEIAYLKCDGKHSKELPINNEMDKIFKSLN